MQDFSEKYRENEGSQILNIWREISQCQFMINNFFRENEGSQSIFTGLFFRSNYLQLLSIYTLTVFKVEPAIDRLGFSCVTSSGASGED